MEPIKDVPCLLRSVFPNSDIVTEEVILKEFQSAGQESVNVVKPVCNELFDASALMLFRFAHVVSLSNTVPAGQ